MNGGRGQRVKARIGRLLLAVILLSSGAAVLWYRHLAGEIAPEAPPEAPENNGRAQTVTRDFRHVETKMDRTLWVIEAQKAEMFEDSARLFVVKITWYGEQEGQMPVVITSQKGRVNFTNRNATLTGEVRAVRADGATLETEKVFWNNAAKTLTAPVPVSIRSALLTFRGEGMVANVAEEWVRLSGRVRGDITLQKKDRRGGREEGHGANS